MTHRADAIIARIVHAVDTKPGYCNALALAAAEKVQRSGRCAVIILHDPAAVIASSTHKHLPASQLFFVEQATVQRMQFPEGLHKVRYYSPSTEFVLIVAVVVDAERAVCKVVLRPTLQCSSCHRSAAALQCSSSCQRSYYCSRRCRKQHAKKHRATCDNKENISSW